MILASVSVGVLLKTRFTRICKQIHTKVKIYMRTCLLAKKPLMVWELDIQEHWYLRTGKDGHLSPKKRSPVLNVFTVVSQQIGRWPPLVEGLSSLVLISNDWLTVSDNSEHGCLFCCQVCGKAHTTARSMWMSWPGRKQSPGEEKQSHNHL